MAHKWSDIIFAIPQGSILGPLLSTIFQYDLSQLVSSLNIANYSHHNTLTQLTKF